MLKQGQQRSTLDFSVWSSFNYPIIVILDAAADDDNDAYFKMCALSLLPCWAPISPAALGGFKLTTLQKQFSEKNSIFCQKW